MATDTLNSYLRESAWTTAESEQSNLLQREATVLLGGFTDGIAQAGVNTFNSIKETGAKFIDKPVSTTVEYVGNHWHEAVAGAAIAMVSPRKWVNAALVAYSMRGLIADTIQAGALAADPENDSQQIRNHYSGAISQEGTAFLSAMPMTMVGGWAGKAGANAVFGRNMGLADAISGKVQWSDLKMNLWNMHDAIRPPKVKLVISDMDNTLSNFSKYAALGIKEGITNMSEKLTQIGHPHTEQQLYELIGKQMDVARSHDYPWSVEMALGERLHVGKTGGMSADQFRADISEPFWKTIDAAMEKHLHTFEGENGVSATLAALKEKGIPVVVLSDAPAFIGLRRLTMMGLDSKVERMYALNNTIAPEGLSSQLVSYGQERIDAMLSLPHSLKEFRALPKAWEKPHTEGFEALMQHYGLRAKAVLMIGDSRVKDLGVAHNAGARGIWAKYGNPAAEYEGILLRLRPLPENAPTPGTTGPRQYPPMLEAAENYGAVLKHLEPKANVKEVAASFMGGVSVLPPWQSLTGYDVWPALKSDPLKN